MIQSGGGDHTSARGPLDESDAQQEWFNFIFESVRRDIHRVPDGRQSRGTAGKDRDECLQISAVLRFQSDGIDFQHRQRTIGDLFADVSVSRADGAKSASRKQIIGFRRSWLR